MISNDKIAEAARQALARKQGQTPATPERQAPASEKPNFNHASEISSIEEEIAAQYKEPEPQRGAANSIPEVEISEADLAPRYPTISTNVIPEDLDFEEESKGPKPGSKEYANEVIWEAHPCWRGMIGWYVKAIGIVLAVSAIAYLAAAAEAIHVAFVPLILILALAIVFGLGKLIRSATVYTITRSQVSERTGIFNTRSEQARLERITNIKISRNIFERLVGIGKINIDTANDKEDILDWWGIPKPYSIQAIIDDLRIEQEFRSTDGT